MTVLALRPRTADGFAPARARAAGVDRRTARVLVATGLLAAIVGLAFTREPLYTAGALVLAGCAYLVWTRPAIAAWTLPVVPVLSGLGRGEPIPGFRLSELLAVGIGLTIIVRGRVEDGLPAPPWRALDWTAALYALAAVAIPFADEVAGKGSGGFGVDDLGPLQYLVYYRACVIVLNTPQRRHRAVQGLLVSSIVTNVAAALQSANVPGVRNEIDVLIGLNPYLTPGYTSQGRATGLFPHWHVLAGYDALIVLVVVAYALCQTRILPPVMLATVGIWALIGIAVSVTATDAIGVVVGAVVVGILTRKLKVLLSYGLPVMLVVGVAFWPLIHERILSQGLGGASGSSGSGTPQTISYRAQLWTHQYLPAIGHSLITGYGNHLPISITFIYPENVYLALLIKGGVVLLLIYVLMTGATLAAARRQARSEGASRPVGIIVFTLVVMLIFMQMLFPYMLTDGLPMALWLLIALVRRGEHIAAAHGIDGSGEG